MAAAPARADGITGLSLSVGFDYTRGDYGGDIDTEILTVPVTAKVSVPFWSFALTVPYVRIDGPGDVVGGGDKVIVTKNGKRQGKTVSTSESGLGDIVAAATFSFPTPPLTPDVDLTAKVKIPTADEDKGLGTGEYDYSVFLDVSYSIAGFAPYGWAGYRIVGEPDGIDLNNQIIAGLGASFDIGGSTTAGLAIEYRESTTDDADDAIELTPYFTWKALPAIRFNFYGLVGLTQGSPDYGGGVKLVIAP